MKNTQDVIVRRTTEWGQTCTWKEGEVAHECSTVRTQSRRTTETIRKSRAEKVKWDMKSANRLELKKRVPKGGRKCRQKSTNSVLSLVVHVWITLCACSWNIQNCNWDKAKLPFCRCSKIHSEYILLHMCKECSNIIVIIGNPPSLFLVSLHWLSSGIWSEKRHVYSTLGREAKGMWPAWSKGVMFPHYLPTMLYLAVPVVSPTVQSYLTQLVLGDI